MSPGVSGSLGVAALLCQVWARAPCCLVGERSISFPSADLAESLSQLNDLTQINFKVLSGPRGANEQDRGQWVGQMNGNVFLFGTKAVHFKSLKLFNIFKKKRHCKM